MTWPPTKLNPMRTIFALTLLVLLAGLTASAQDGGTVAGVVVSTWDGSPLPGVTITVRGTTLATQTDAGGKFELKNVPTGDQVLRFSKAGYAAAVVTDVRVLLGQSSTVNGNLRPEFYEMEEYEVTAEEFTDQTAQILETRKDASALMEGIGADFMSKVGAGDAAEALSKVSGASIADGKFAVIRGLADRYTSTTLNGTDLPSADPDRKAAQLDLLPTQVIERMDVAKTFSPDMGGGFAGGAIDIMTKSPDRAIVSFSLGTSYNTQASLNDNFLTSDRGDKDWLAMDDGTRELPAVARNSSAAGGVVQPQQQIKSSFKSTQLLPLPDKSGMNSSLALTFGDVLKMNVVKFGYLGSLNYKNDYKFYDDGFTRKYKNGVSAGPTRDMKDAKGTIEYNWSAASTLTLGVGEDHELKFNFLYVQSAEDEARRLQGQDADVGSLPGESYVDESVLHWTERNLTYYQLAGEHRFPAVKDIKFNWAGSLSTATQDEPDYRIFRFLATPPNDYLPTAASPPSFPTRYWRELEEKNSNVRGDLTIPLPSYNEKDNALKAGVALSDSSRDYYQRGFQMIGGGNNPFNTSGDPQSFLSPTNAANAVTYRNFEANITYQGSQVIKAGYLLGDWAILNWLRVAGGARFESTELTLAGRSQTLNNRPLTGANLTRDDVLPSLNATISLHEDVKLRAAWSQTVVRPTYREIAPVYIYDIGESKAYQGNPNLTFAESQNYDLRLEWYPRDGEIISLSGFLKQIEKPIELRSEGGDSITFHNADYADVMGVEFEFRSQLDNFFAPLKEFTLGFNAAYIDSEVPVPASYSGPRGLWGATENTHPMYDQPEYVLNADLTWEHKATGTTMTVAGGVVGRRLIVVGLERPDEYEEPAPQLDVFLSQKLGKNWKCKLSAKNLLNPAYENSQTWPTGGKVILKSYTKGITFGISLGCEF